MKVMMKKEYITPAMIVRHVIIEGIMQQESMPVIDNPDPEPDWGDEEAKGGSNLWFDDDE